MNIARAPGSSNWEEKAVKHTLLLTSSIILSQLLLILRGFILAKFLGPSLYGLWHGLRVIINNSDYSSLGIYDGMKREVPYCRGKGDWQRVQGLIEASFFSGMVLAIITSCGLVGISFLFSNQFGQLTTFCLWITAGILVARQVYLFLCRKFESEARFFSYSKAELSSVGLGFILAIGLMFILNIYGFLIGILLGYLFIDLTVLSREGLMRRSFQVHFGLELMRIGMPIMIIGLLLSLLKSVDKLMVLFFLDRVRLGYYGMAFVAASFIGFCPLALRTVLYPRLMEKMGEKGDQFNLKEFLIGPSLILVCLLPFLIGILYFFVPIGIGVFLPQYVPSIPSMKILILGFYFIALLEVPLYMLIGINLHRKLLPVLSSSLLFLLGVNYLVLSFGFDIEGVSFTVGLTFLGLTSTVMLLASNQFNQTSKDKVHFFSQIYLPFFCMTFALVLLDRMMGIQDVKGYQALFRALFQFLIFLILFTPFFVYINRKINIIDRIKKAVRLKDGLTRPSFFED